MEAPAFYVGLALSLGLGPRIRGRRKKVEGPGASFNTDACPGCLGCYFNLAASGYSCKALCPKGTTSSKTPVQVANATVDEVDNWELALAKGIVGALVVWREGWGRAIEYVDLFGVYGYLTMIQPMFWQFS